MLCLFCASVAACYIHLWGLCSDTVGWETLFQPLSWDISGFTLDAACSESLKSFPFLTESYWADDDSAAAVFSPKLAGLGNCLFFDQQSRNIIASTEFRVILTDPLQWIALLSGTSVWCTRVCCYLCSISCWPHPPRFAHSDRIFSVEKNILNF